LLGGEEKPRTADDGQPSALRHLPPNAFLHEHRASECESRINNGPFSGKAAMPKLR
jgi:hypothetical protein